MKYFSLFDMWKQTCSVYGDKIAFTDNTESEYISYRQAFREVCFLAEKLQKFGLKRFDNVCLFAVNSPRWLVLEQAVITLGAVCVSKTSEIDIKELDFVFTNSESVALITDNVDIINYFIENNEKFLEQIKFVLYTGKAEINISNPKIYELKNLLAELDENTVVKVDWVENPDDIAYINYTSGTSSFPKGAMLPNIGMAYVTEELQRFNDIKEDKTFVVTFPLSSAGGKSFNLLCFSQGCRVMYTPYKQFYDVLDKYQPDYLHCAPKIIQTMHSKLMEAVRKKGFFFRKIFGMYYALSTQILRFERRFLYRNKLLFTAPLIDFIKSFIDKNIYKQIRNTLLKDETVVFVGSAHLAKPLEDFLQIMDIKHVQHYGLTETTGLDVSNTLDSQKKNPYTVGVPFSKTVLRIVNPETREELKQGEVGLITLQGPEILKGYYKNPEATAKTILEGHFLNTGDLGYIDRNGYLIVLSRYDDVIVLSNGYNIYTPLLENEAKDSQFVNQLVITGQGKPYLTALIVLNSAEYISWCQKNNVNASEPNKNNAFKEFLIEHLNEKIKRKNNYKYYEKLKKIYFLKEEFTVENGLLTGTLKVKYRKIVNTYQKEIDNLYKE